MRNPIHPTTGLLAAAALVIGAGQPFDLSWNTIDGGGVMRSASADGRFGLSGSIGQPDAGVMTGGAFELGGGFWFETPPGDCNGNGVGDLGDHAEFIACMTGPAAVATGECLCFDTDGNGTVDFRDFRKIQNEFWGE